MSQLSRNNQATQKPARVQPSASAQSKPPKQMSEQQVQEQFNQLVSEVRLLEAYYQEVVTRQQSVSAAMMDSRAALDAIETLSKTVSNELLVPVGGGTLIFASAEKLDKLIVSVGAGVAIEKKTEAAKIFLQSRRQELEKALTSLENQRKEIGSRLEVGRATIQRLAGATVQ